MFEVIKQLIEKHSTIILHRHKNPDGDALGAQIGLKLILQERYPDKKILVVGDMTPRYAFIAQGGMDTVTDADWHDALAIILDTSARTLISDERYTTAAATARIDHHIFCEKIAECEVTDTSYESCCSLITAFAIECGYPVSADAAKALYTGMVTDSGRFRYDSTSSQTHRLASFLMERSFSTADIYRNLYADDFANIRLRAQFVMKIQFSDKNVAYIYTPLEELKTYSADTFSISRGMVGVMAEIRGVDIWANFTETEDGVLCEIRSSRYNINPVARKYGGGGHEKASGATLKDKDEAMRLLEDLGKIAEGAK